MAPPTLEQVVKKLLHIKVQAQNVVNEWNSNPTKETQYFHELMNNLKEALNNVTPNT